MLSKDRITAKQKDAVLRRLKEETITIACDGDEDKGLFIILDILSNDKYAYKVITPRYNTFYMITPDGIDYIDSGGYVRKEFIRTIKLICIIMTAIGSVFAIIEVML